MPKKKGGNKKVGKKTVLGEKVEKESMMMEKKEMGSKSMNGKKKSMMKKGMKYCLAALGFCFLYANLSFADSLYATGYDQGVDNDTWFIMSNDGTAITDSDLTLIARDATYGVVVGSTNPTIRANETYKQKLSDMIVNTTWSYKTSGTVEIQGSDTVLNHLNMYVLVKPKDRRSSGYIIPIYGVSTGLGNKYTP